MLRQLQPTNPNHVILRKALEEENPNLYFMTSVVSKEALIEGWNILKWEGVSQITEIAQDLWILGECCVDLLRASASAFSDVHNVPGVSCTTFNAFTASTHSQLSLRTFKRKII